MHGQASRAPSHYQQTLTFPPSCVRLSVTLHQDPSAPGYCLTIEARDAHTAELLEAIVDPLRPYSTLRGVAADVSLDVRQVLQALLDPDPF